MKFLQTSTAYLDDMLGAGKFSQKKIVREANLKINDIESRTQALDNIGFSYFSKTNEEVASFRKSLAFFTASEYGTWKAFSQDADETMNPFLTKAMEITGLKSIKLEYADRFVFSGEPEDADFSEILKMSIIGLPDAATANGKLWHNHAGWFDQIDQGSVLVNSNLDVTDVTHRDQPDKPLKSVGIFTLVETRFTGLITEFEMAKIISNSLHSKSKDVFRSAITDAAAKMVGL